MIELLVVLGLLVTVVVLLERNHQRTVTLSRMPFALDLESDHSPDQRRFVDDLRALERAARADGVLGARLAPEAASAAPQPIPGRRHPRPRWT